MIETLDRVLYLKGIELFADLPSEWLVPVAQLATEATFEPGETVMRAGDPGDCLYVILEGDLRVQAGEQTLATLHAGECVGEMSLLDTEPRLATVVAASEVVALRIAQDEFYGLLAERAEIARALIAVLSRRLRATVRAQATPRKAHL